MATASTPNFQDALADCDPGSANLQDVLGQTFNDCKTTTVPDRFKVNTTKPSGASAEVGAEMSNLNKMAKIFKQILQLVIYVRTTGMAPDDFLKATAVAATAGTRIAQQRSGELWVSGSFSPQVAKTYRSLKSNPTVSDENQKQLLNAIELQNRLDKAPNSRFFQGSGRGNYSGSGSGYNNSYRGGHAPTFSNRGSGGRGRRQFNFYSEQSPRNGATNSNPNNQDEW
eukprot:Lithocolla_globosa_v1_NODE_4785_length_1366_cov_35.699466.p2 type:complete len:227 gc:universal NODE_4785_length_1366_cov_35.699466:1248-568(-)